MHPPRFNLTPRRDPPSLGKMGWLLVVLAYGVVLALAGWRLWNARLEPSLALEGQLGADLLSGRLAWFIPGQDQIGGLGGLLCALPFAFLGVGSLGLHLTPAVLLLGAMLALHRLMWRYFHDPGMVMGLWYWALPPALWLCALGQAAPHQALSLFLGAVLLWLTAGLLERGRWPWWRTGVWGLAAGAALWTNLSAALVVTPCLMTLALAGCRRWLWLPGLCLLAGLGLGLTPAITYHLAPSAGLWHLAAVWPPTLAGVADFLGRWLPEALGSAAIWDNAWLWDHWPWWLWLPPCLLLVGLGCVGLARLARRERVWFPMVPLAVGLLALVAGLVQPPSVRNPGFALYLFLVLPMIWAWWADRLSRLRPPFHWLAVPLALVLLGVNLAGYAWLPAHGFPLAPNAEVGYDFRLEPRQHQFVDLARQREWRHFYSLPPQDLALLAQGDPVTVHPWDDPWARRSAQVDLAPSPVFNLSLSSTQRLLGTNHLLCPPRECIREVHTDFQPPRAIDRLVTRMGWTAQELEGPDLAGTLSDQDLSSGYLSAGPAREGQGFTLDLGREERVSGLALMAADPRELPRGLCIEGAGKDQEFRVLRQARRTMQPFFWSGPHPFLKLRYGRTESYWPATRLRYLRISYLGRDDHPWAVGEVLLFSPADQGRAPDWEGSGERLLEALGRGGVRRLYADAWPSALARLRGPAEVETVIANLNQDDQGHGRDLPLLPPIEPASGGAVLVLRRDVAAASDLLRFAGIGFLPEAAGDYLLLRLAGDRHWDPVPVVAVESSLNPDQAGGLARPEGGPWSTGQPQTPGMSLTLDLGEPQRVRGVRLWTPDHPQDFPRGLKAELSLDGERWVDGRLSASAPLVMTGILPLAQPGAFAQYLCGQPVTTRYIRLVLTGRHPQRPWTVQRLEVLAP